MITLKWLVLILLMLGTLGGCKMPSSFPPIIIIGKPIIINGVSTWIEGNQIEEAESSK